MIVTRINGDKEYIAEAHIVKVTKIFNTRHGVNQYTVTLDAGEQIIVHDPQLEAFFKAEAPAVISAGIPADIPAV